MFYCDPCAERYHWPRSVFKSEGRCEMCGKGAVCNDVPSSALPSTKPEADDR